jgi:translation initiation factor 4E
MSSTPYFLFYFLLDVADHAPCSETMKRVLSLPPDTKVEWKSHDSSILQRTAIEESRREKTNHHHNNDKRPSKQQQQQQQQSQQQADDHKNTTVAT